MPNIPISTNEAKWEQLRNEYPALRTCTNLNTPTCGAMARSSVEIAGEEQERLLVEGAPRFLKWLSTGKLEVRSTIAECLSTQDENIALVPGFSKGIALLAPFLVQRPRVLLVKGDYPTLLAPFKRSPFRPVIIEPNADGTVPMEMIEEAVVREKPDIVAISHVQWSSGYTIDLKAFADLCREHNALSVVDATQSWCCVPLNATTIDVDVIGASCYKWPLAGFGNGFMYVSEPLRAEIQKTQSLDVVEQLALGHSDPVSFYKLNDALQRYKRIGPQEIANRVDALCTYAIEQLDAIGIPVLNGRDPAHRAGILIIKGDRTRLDKLEERGVQAALRGAGIRIGLHYYNNKEDIDRLVVALK